MAEVIWVAVGEVSDDAVELISINLDRSGLTKVNKAVTSLGLRIRITHFCR